MLQRLKQTKNESCVDSQVCICCKPASPNTFQRTLWIQVWIFGSLLTYLQWNSPAPQLQFYQFFAHFLLTLFATNHASLTNAGRGDSFAGPCLKSCSSWNQSAPLHTVYDYPVISSRPWPWTLSTCGDSPSLPHETGGANYTNTLIAHIKWTCILRGELCSDVQDYHKILGSNYTENKINRKTKFWFVSCVLECVYKCLLFMFHFEVSVFGLYKHVRLMFVVLQWISIASEFVEKRSSWFLRT